MRSTGISINASGTTAAGTAGDVLPQHPGGRNLVALSNPSDTDMWFSWVTTAAANGIGSWKLTAGTGVEWNTPGFVRGNKLSLYCASAKAYTLEWSP